MRSGLADEVLFVPTRQPPHKADRPLTAPEHRLQMLQDAIAPFSEFSCSDIEIQRTEGPSYTFDTLDVLRRFFPGHALHFLMGMDSLVDLQAWYRATELVQRFQFIIYPRLGVTPPSFAELAGHFGARNARKLLLGIAPLHPIPVRATEIRAQCAAAKNVAGQLPESVLRYIRDNALYTAVRET